VVEALREAVGIEAKLVKGHGGIFTVAVGGEVVARKTWEGFPTEVEVVRAVRAAVQRV